MSYEAEVLKDSPSVYGRLGEKEGTSCADAIGGTAGTYKGGYTLNQTGLVTGDSDTAVKFNGSTAYVEFAARTGFDLGDKFSIECIVKLEELGKIQTIAYKGTNAYGLRIGEANKVQLVKGGVAVVAESSKALETGIRYHIVATKNGGEKHVYVNGVEETGFTGAGTLENTAVAFQIGSQSGTERFFKGIIDEVAIYKNSVLSETRVNAHYAWVKGEEPIAPENTVAPAISGTLKVGETLECSEGTWKNSPTSYSYQWEISDKSSGGWIYIPGATSKTYVVESSGKGRYLRCIVTATNLWGSNSANAASVQITGTASATPVFAGTSLGKYTLQEREGAITEVLDPAGSGQTVFKFHVLNTDVFPITPTGDPRAQALSPNMVPNDAELWVQGSFYIPEGSPAVTTWLELFSIYGAPFAGTAPWGAKLSGSNHLVWQRNETYSYDVPWSVNLEKGRWYKFKMHQLHSETGWVEFWIDGTQVKFFDPAAPAYYNPNKVAETTKLSMATRDSAINAGVNAAKIQCYYEHNMVEEFTLYHKPLEVLLGLGKPTAITGVVRSLTPYRVSLIGEVNPNSFSTKYYFEYGKTEAYGNKTKEIEVGEGIETVAVSQSIAGLEAGTTYYFRLVAINSQGETKATGTFKTSQLRIRHKPPLDLDLEIETTQGNFRLSANAVNSLQRPTGLSFSTQRGDGFATGSAVLNREILRDYPDVGLLDTWRMISHQGDVAYEGRLHSNPRTNDPSDQINVSLVGWMTYLKSRTIPPLIVDRRLSPWADPSMQRQANLRTSGYVYSGDWQVAGQEAGAAAQGVIQRFTRIVSVETTGPFALTETWFYAGDQPIAEIRYDIAGVETPGAPWNTFAFFSTDDIASSFLQGTEHNGETASNQALVADNTSYRYVTFLSAYTGTFTGDGDWAIHWRNPRVFGNSILTKRGVQPNEGYYVSDIISYILEVYYPKIKWAGEENTTLVQQATWHDNPSYGYDIIQQLNNLTLWETNVWEGPKFYFEPADLTKYDWIIRTDEPGVKVQFQGDSIENFANGASVTFTDFLGVKRTLYPNEHSELRDERESNPANRHNEPLWVDTEVPWQCTETEAIEFGRAYLGEYNRPKRPGTYRIEGGYIKDSAGAWQQGWKVRNSETIGIMNHPDDSPRLIYATNWDQESRTLEITVDAPPKYLDALIARHQVAVEAR